MNAIETYNAILAYTDYSRAGRYRFSEVNLAVSDAMDKLIEGITDSDKGKLTGIDRIQAFRDRLYTLIKPFTSVPTNIGFYNDDIIIDHVNYPSDYRTYDRMNITIGGVSGYVRDTTSNELGPLLDCSFRKPTNNKVYFLEDATGLSLYRGATGVISSSTLTYIKKPLDFNMGDESNVIQQGTGVLALTTSYTVLDNAIYNGVNYISGKVFTTNGVLSDLTSGEVILTSLLVPIELPEKTHSDIAKMAAAILLGQTEDFESSGFAEKESQ